MLRDSAGRVGLDGTMEQTLLAPDTLTWGYISAT